MYIMKRTQLYLDEDTWKALHIRARQSGISVSELVRQAVRDKYRPFRADRQQAMQAWVGTWKERKDLPNTETYVRQLRKGERLRRVSS
jgi:plasmid stability protein